MRGATVLLSLPLMVMNISIHAPREGSDDAVLALAATCATFLSTLPARGATLCFLRNDLYDAGFLSTLPARGATERW